MTAHPPMSHRMVLPALLVLSLALAPFPAAAGVTRLTVNDVSDGFPQINRSGQIVWQASDDFTA